MSPLHCSIAPTSYLRQGRVEALFVARSNIFQGGVPTILKSVLRCDEKGKENERKGEKTESKRKS